MTPELATVWSDNFDEPGGVLGTVTGDCRDTTENTRPPFTDLTQYLNGDAKQELPTVAMMLEGRCLFYSGRINEIHGEPSVGKTNIMLAAAIAVLKTGGNVIYIDPEDGPAAMSKRLLFLGADRENVIERFHYLHNPTPEEIAQAKLWAQTNKHTLVVGDGLAEMMAAAGFSEDSNQEVINYFREHIRGFADAGAAVVISDHVTKNSETRNGWARGAGAKLGRYDGVSYEIILGQAYSPGTAGFVRLKISKDRNGGVGPKGKVVAELHFMPTGDNQTRPIFKQPDDGQSGPFRPTAYMAKIIDHLKLAGEANVTALMKVGGKAEYIRKSIVILESEGAITYRQKGQQKIYRLAENEV